MDMPSESDFFKPIFSRRRPLEGWRGLTDINRPMLGLGSESRGMNGGLAPEIKEG